MIVKKTKEEWATIFSDAKCGHVLWDGWATDPYNPIHAYHSSHKFIDHASYYGFFKIGGKVLDLGCGNGRLAIALSEKPVDYTGIDPVKNSIDFCQEAFKDYPHLKFQFMDIKNETFNKNGNIDPRQFTIPFDDQYFDTIICYSVFTHLQEIEIATRYMCEITRVLKPKGKFFSTWYRSPPNELDNFVGRTAYLESDIMTILHNFSFQHTYGGHSNQFYDQWAIFATKH
jgi:SAM-dependent methyltransferase